MTGKDDLAEKIRLVCRLKAAGASDGCVAVVLGIDKERATAFRKRHRIQRDGTIKPLTPRIWPQPGPMLVQNEPTWDFSGENVCNPRM